MAENASELAMTGAADRRMEMGGKMPLRNTFRVGRIMTTDYIMPKGEKSTLPYRAKDSECHRLITVRSVLYRVGGLVAHHRMCRLRRKCSILTFKKSEIQAKVA